MTTPLFPDPPTYADVVITEGGRAKFNPIWMGWFIKLTQFISAIGGGGGVITHNSLTGIQGGTTSEYYHLTSARYSTLTGVQNANKVFAGPASGADAAATFRVLATLDLPNQIVAGGPIGGTSVTPVITYNTAGQLTVVSFATITPAAIGAPSGSGNSTGTNTGDQDLSHLVVGPASVTSGNVTLFDGTTGKLVKDGGTLGTAAFTATTAYDAAGAATAAVKGMKFFAAVHG